jgi:acetoin utilization deacetylase AcuC-like enzyme
VRIVYSPRYVIDIGPHVFPTLKYRMVHARLIEAGVIRPEDVVEPEPASWNELALVHTGEYLSKMRAGTMSSEDVTLLELPKRWWRAFA